MIQIAHRPQRPADLAIRFVLALGFLFGNAVVSVHGQSTHLGLGAIPYADTEGTGVAFRVWAPGAVSVHLAGTFNDWSTTSHPLVADPTNGTWSLDLPDAAVGDRYKYVLDGTLWRTDPRAREYGATSNNSSVVLGPPSPLAPFDRPATEEMVIYELHVGTFYDPTPADGIPATFRDAIAGLDHLVGLGVNAVCVMPCAEFLTARSWGYNPAGLFAVERDYGGREGFEQFVAACHARGIAVLVDVVHNHWGTPVGDLWQFDGTAADTNTGGIYFYEDSARATTPWGPRPNFDAPEVHAFILDSVAAWLELGCDGFRWDAVDYLTRTGGGGETIPAGAALLQDAAELVQTAGGVNIAENASADVPGAFDAEWAISFRGTLTSALSRSNPAERADTLAAAIEKLGLESVVYVESHDTAGKFNSNAIRWPLKVAETNRTLAMTGIALAWLGGGMPMLFQGQESFQTNVWHDNRPLEWNFDAGEQQALAFHRDLLRLRRNLDGIGPALMTTAVVAIATNGFIVVERGAEPQTRFVAIANLKNELRETTVVMPATGEWYRVLGTADPRYGNPGGGTVSLVAANEPVAIAVPGYATLVFARHYAPDDDMDSDGLPNAWEAEYFDHPAAADPDQDSDKDGTSNRHEWLADTRPRDETSFFHVVETVSEPAAFLLRFASSSNRLYDVDQASAPGAALEPLVRDLPGTPPFNVVTDSAPTGIQRVYQLRAKPRP